MIARSVNKTHLPVFISQIKENVENTTGVVNQRRTDKTNGEKKRKDKRIQNTTQKTKIEQPH